MARVVLCVALAIGCVPLSGCKDTDFLKRIVISTSSEIVDPNRVTYYNSPDGETESTSFPAFDLSDESGYTDATQKVVVYGSQPDTDLPTRHSVYAERPRFPGIEASDGVRIVPVDDEQAVDTPTEQPQAEQAEALSVEDVEEVTESADDGQRDTDDAARGDGRSENAGAQKGNGSSTGEELLPGRGGASDEVPGGLGQTEGESTNGGAEAGGDAAGTSSPDEQPPDPEEELPPPEEPQPQQEDQPQEPEEGGADKSPVDGTSARDSGGYGGEELIYEPGNRAEEVPKTDRAAAIGQAAVIVQAIAGKGALAAMDEYTYQGLGPSGADAAIASSFKAVFGDELADGFEKNALLWVRDGSSPDCLADSEGMDNAQAVISALSDEGKGGVIFFCGNVGDQRDLFSSKQLKAFRDASVSLVPLNLETEQGILDAVKAVGDSLSESKYAEQDSVANARLYADTFNAIQAACEDARTNAPFVTGCVATGFEKGVQLINSRQKSLGANVDTTDGVLFTDTGDLVDLREQLMLHAGVYINGLYYARSSDRYGLVQPVIPLSLEVNKECFSGYASDGPFSRFTSLKTSADNLVLYNSAVKSHESDSDDSPLRYNALGSKSFPYIVVSGSGGLSAADVKEAVVKSANKKGTLYSTDPSLTYSQIRGAARGGGPYCSWMGYEKGLDGNVFSELGVEFADCVREQPVGLLGTWTSGSFECVLESAWLCELYSKKPAKSNYEPVNDMGKFHVTIGDKACDNAKQAIEAFYATIYRCPTSQGAYSYDDVATDSFKGLK